MLRRLFVRITPSDADSPTTVAASATREAWTGKRASKYWGVHSQSANIASGNGCFAWVDIGYRAPLHHPVVDGNIDAPRGGSLAEARESGRPLVVLRTLNSTRPDSSLHSPAHRSPILISDRMTFSEREPVRRILPSVTDFARGLQRAEFRRELVDCGPLVLSFRP